MNRDELLAAFNNHGDDAGADYNDGVDGWFGWHVTDSNTLIITFTDADENDFEAEWALEPMGEDS